MSNFVIVPKVNEAREFIEIANDFSNSLDLVREAISNSYDADATQIDISFDVIKECGESILKITIFDNGTGMDQNGLQSFFDLGNSLRRDDKNSIGEKGHGTKVYFNSKKIEVITVKKGSDHFHAIMEDPFRELHKGKMPTVNVSIIDSDFVNGTKIIIYGYNDNSRDKFTHDILKDHIMWFTKHGSIGNEFLSKEGNIKTTINLKGLGRDNAEEILHGHYFPSNTDETDKLFDKHMDKAPNFYSKKIIKTGQLEKHPEIKYEAVFCVEGKNVKYNYNPMLRRKGYKAPTGAYTAGERYGIWLCKDFIPIQRKNEWIVSRGFEYTKFHAFFNCQALSLTANRGSVDNTCFEILKDIQSEVKKIYDSIVSGDDWTTLKYLEGESAGYQTTEKEKKQFELRIKKVNKANVTEYGGIRLIEPERESGVFSIFLILSIKKSDLFPFQIIDYDTHEGIDVIVKGDKTNSITNSKLYYVEFKQTLKKEFNHSFENLHSVICWETDIKHDDIIKDINGKERTMCIRQPDNEKDYTHYFLDNCTQAHKIEVYVLKQFLKERLNIDFRSRTKEDII